MALILNIETATKVCSVALYQDDNLLGLQELFIDKSHSEYLAVIINDLMNYTGRKFEGLAAVAISKGPGSYTGLRIGTSTAKGLCYALDIPLISINTLKAMAVNLAGLYEDTYLCPMIDARRMEAYFMILDREHKEILSAQAKIIDENVFSNLLKDNKIVFFGNGSDKCKPILSKHSNAIFVESIHPTAKSVGILAFEKFKTKEFEDVAYFEPYYLKDFIATKAKKLL
jgi:tRNA threonylcarbamoyladenosine biosynthesis protein TsaB